MVADTVREFFGDKSSIDNIVNSNPSLADKIRDGIKSVKATIQDKTKAPYRNKAEIETTYKQLTEIEKRFNDGLKEMAENYKADRPSTTAYGGGPPSSKSADAALQDGKRADGLRDVEDAVPYGGAEGEKYSPIEYDENGQAYVRIENEVLDGVPKNQWAKTVSKWLNQNIQGNEYTAQSDGDRIKTTRRFTNEYGRGAQYGNLSDEQFDAKMNLAGNIDEAITISQKTGEAPDSKNSDGTLKHKGFAKYGWDYRTFNFEYNGKKYSANLNIAKGDSGHKAYEVTKIEEVTPIGESSKDEGTRVNSVTSSDNSISDGDGNVKYSVKENNYSRRLAGEVIKEYNATLKKDEISDDIENVISMFSERGFTEENFEKAWSATEDIAGRIAESIRVTDDNTREEYKRLINWVRNTPVSISDADKADITSADSFNEFRKRNFGSIRLTNNGAPIDIAYQELAEQFPQYFDAQNETHPADQLIRIQDVLQDLKPSERSLTGKEMSDVTDDIAARLFNDIVEESGFSAETESTEAERSEFTKADWESLMSTERETPPAIGKKVKGVQTEIDELTQERKKDAARIRLSEPNL